VATSAELGRLRRELAELRARQEIGELLVLFGFHPDCGAVVQWLVLSCEDAVVDVRPAVQALRGRMCTTT